MKNKNLYQVFFFILTILFMWNCKKDEVQPENLNASTINDYVSQFPDWVDQTKPMEWDSLLTKEKHLNDDSIPATCDVYSKAITVSTEDIVSIGTNFGKIWPGAIIEGNSLENGDLKLINIARAGITLNTNLPINKTFREIENPNSVSVQQAISEMQIESGLMPDGLEAGAGQMNTRIEEYSTFIQAMLSMGISGGFTEPESKIKLSGEVNGSIKFELNTHSVIVKFVQNAFTVRLADDLLTSPSDFFAGTVTPEDIKKLQSNGTMNSDNVPLYIESVTYGRFLLFTLTSTTVSSALTLQAAVGASWDNYANAGAELSTEFKAALASKTTKIFSAGGSEDAANAAVAILDWSKFFVKAPVTTAVPISFVARTLNGKKKVVLVDNAIYTQRGNCKFPEKIKLNVELTNVVLENPKIGTAQYNSGTFKLPSQTIADLLQNGHFITAINTDKIVVAGKGHQEYIWDINVADPEIDKLLIRSANILVQNNQIFKFPFKEFREGVQNRTWRAVNNRGESMRFEYRITKSFE